MTPNGRSEPPVEEQLTLDEALRDPSEPRPGLARRDGPSTQQRAAYLCEPNAASQRGVLLRLMHEAGDVGMTALEAEVAMHDYFPLMRNVRARITELRRDSWLIFTGRTRMTESGYEAEVNLFNPYAEQAYRKWLNR